MVICEKCKEDKNKHCFVRRNTHNGMLEDDYAICNECLMKQLSQKCANRNYRQLRYIWDIEDLWRNIESRLFFMDCPFEYKDHFLNIVKEEIEVIVHKMKEEGEGDLGFFKGVKKK